MELGLCKRWSYGGGYGVRRFLIVYETEYRVCGLDY